MGKIPVWRTEENPTVWTWVGTDVLGPFYVRKTSQKDKNEMTKTFVNKWTDLIFPGILVDGLDSVESCDDSVESCDDSVESCDDSVECDY